MVHCVCSRVVMTGGKRGSVCVCVRANVCVWGGGGREGWIRDLGFYSGTPLPTPASFIGYNDDVLTSFDKRDGHNDAG